MSNEPKWTKGPWASAYDGSGDWSIGQPHDPQGSMPSIKVWPHILDSDEGRANVKLVVAAPDMATEMSRYLEILERAEADPEIWSKLTAGTGIATANGYRAALAKAVRS